MVQFFRIEFINDALNVPIVTESDMGWDGCGWLEFGLPGGILVVEKPDLDVYSFFASTPEGCDTDDLVGETVYFPQNSASFWSECSDMTCPFLWDSDTSFYRGFPATNYSAGDVVIISIGISLEYLDRDLANFTAAHNMNTELMATTQLQTLIDDAATYFSWGVTPVVDFCQVTNGFYLDGNGDCIDINDDDPRCNNLPNRASGPECIACDNFQFGEFCEDFTCDTSLYSDGIDGTGECCFALVGDSSCDDLNCVVERGCFFDSVTATATCGPCPAGWEATSATDCTEILVLDACAAITCTGGRTCLYNEDGEAMCGACPELTIVDGDFGCQGLPSSAGILIAVLGYVLLVLF